MKTINLVTGVGLASLVSIVFFCGTASAGHCINKKTGQLVRCTVKAKKDTSKTTRSVKHRGKPANLKFIPWTENAPKK